MQTHLRQRAGPAWAALHTIRVRLTLWYVALLALILLAFSGFLYFSLSSRLYGEVDRSLLATAQQIAATLEVEDGMPHLGTGAEVLPPGTIAVVYDRLGQQVIANDPRQSLPVLSGALAGAVRGQQSFDRLGLQGQEWRVLTGPLVAGGRTVGILQLARSERDVELALRQLLILLGLAVPITLLLAIAGGLFFAGRALGPIDRITRAAAAIGADDLAQRLDARGRDEVGRLAATFNGMLARLEQAFQRQRAFTADASHELRTPLAMVASQIDVARDRPRTAEEYEQVLDSLREDVARMTLLVGQLLTLARADAGREALDREPVDLAALAEGVAGAMQPLAEAREVHLTVAPGTEVTVMADQARLSQLVINLVDNAIKYTPQQGSVTVSAQREGNRARLVVADTGIGIGPEHLPRLFDRFYRADPSRARADGGIGLGLAICRWIAESHGGRIDVASQLGRGTTFTLLLPVAPSVPAAPPTRPALAALQPRANG